ncbi:adenine phosphoribosyltransferase [SAR202 cluster bacterium AD-804-J14_MRT_500m]|nr:adenine phosphoribosyltransferase [SAR202 cluster bacterium AD-804-J14_MRT_500m]
MDLTKYIRDIPDFPKPGILFKDITPLLQAPDAFSYVIDQFSAYADTKNIDTVVAIDARGFLFGSPLAHRLHKPLVPVRKKGKLPAETNSLSYALEYGTDTIEVHKDGVRGGDRVVIVDDLLATGGTVSAACKLVEQSGGIVVGVLLVIDLTDLNGRSKLQGYDILSLIDF